MAQVLLFGRLADLAGWRETERSASSLSELKEVLAAEDPALGEALSGASVKAAVNRRLAHGDHELSPDDEVAFLPPMSGG